MKIYVILLITAFSSCGVSQTNKKNSLPVTACIDSLKEYSKLLTLTKKTSKQDNYTVIGIATGFFIRKEKKLYLVSANHVFTGNDPFRVNRVDSLAPDLMMFRYKMDNERDTFINIYLDSIKKIYPPKSINDCPDAIAYEIDLPQSSQIKSIENFVYKDVDINKYDSLFFWGFPAQSSDMNQSLRYYIENPMPKKYRGICTIPFDSLNFSGSPVENYGSSGSPVFTKKVINGKEQLVFIGIMSSGSIMHNRSNFVFYKALLKLLH